jgi:predicted ATPase/class 3 adenylate cyclase
MGERPSGTVTFLFTDIEGSTRRWEADSRLMSSSLAAHDEVLQSTVAELGGWVFKHTGDGVCAAFGSPGAAIEAAVRAQRRLLLSVRMGVATGEAEQRAGDYFGPVLNQTARVMAAAHGRQILVAGSTAGLVQSVELLDLGEHLLRDLSRPTRLYQVCAPGLYSTFPPPRTVDVVHGNLPVSVGSFVGRETDRADLAALAGAHRLVTLTGVGGVGKTRLAVETARDLNDEYRDGAWLIELASIGEPDAVPDAVATALGITAKAGLTITESVIDAVAGRELLIVLDNCEHVLHAAADIADALTSSARPVTVMATSRERLGIGAENVYPVVPLEVRAGVTSAAVELFVERARAEDPAFDLGNAERAEAVVEICQRLDGIALAIELAAARMASMTPQDVRDRLGDPFRLLSRPRRSVARHQTLRQTVQWSYELLSDAEREVLRRCSVFANGFDVAGATHVCEPAGLDEYDVLQVLDSLVRKSLITAERSVTHARYGFLETIRQYAHDQLDAHGAAEEIRDRHADYFGKQSLVFWETWNGPNQRSAVDWLDTEFGNLRAGFSWARDRGNLVTAANIAAHSTIMAWSLQRFEPVAWVEEILDEAKTAELRCVPRLLSAASLCSYTGREREALEYAQAAVALRHDPSYDPFDGWDLVWEANAYANLGILDGFRRLAETIVGEPGWRHAGLAGRLYVLPLMGEADQARAIADDAVQATRQHGNPLWIAFALLGMARAFNQTDSLRALSAYREAFAVARAHRLRYWEVRIAQEAAVLEATYGDQNEALDLLDSAIESHYRTGDHADLADALGYAAVLFDRLERPDVACTLFHLKTNFVLNMDLPATEQHLRLVLGEARFDHCLAVAGSMTRSDAVEYAHSHIRLARSQEAV